MTERQASLTPNLSPCCMATHRWCTERIQWHTNLLRANKLTADNVAMYI